MKCSGWHDIWLKDLEMSIKNGRAAMESFFKDIKYGLRMLWKNPGFTLLAVFALALGIGANTAIFSVINAVLLKPLPYKEPDRLVMISAKNPNKGIDALPMTPANYFDLKEQNRVFEDMAYSRDVIYTLTGGGEPESIIGYRFTANFLPVMGA